MFVVLKLCKVSFIENRRFALCPSHLLFFFSLSFSTNKPPSTPSRGAGLPMSGNSAHISSPPLSLFSFPLPPTKPAEKQSKRFFFFLPFTTVLLNILLGTNLDVLWNGSKGFVFFSVVTFALCDVYGGVS